jgi:hypothetical protein
MPKASGGGPLLPTSRRGRGLDAEKARRGRDRAGTSGTRDGERGIEKDPRAVQATLRERVNGPGSRHPVESDADADDNHRHGPHQVASDEAILSMKVASLPWKPERKDPKPRPPPLRSPRCGVAGAFPEASNAAQDTILSVVKTVTEHRHDDCPVPAPGRRRGPAEQACAASSRRSGAPLLP